MRSIYDKIVYIYGKLVDKIKASTPAGYPDLVEKVDAIDACIPDLADADNQLADKEFVNSSIATSTATFRGTYVLTDLGLDGDPFSATHDDVAAAVQSTLDRLGRSYDGSDYVFVQVPQNPQPEDADSGNPVMSRVDRYKCVETGTDPVVKSWEYEWTLNNSSFTAAQWAAIVSGITSGLVAKLGALPTADELARALAGKLGKSEPVSWAELRALRDGGNLVPGQQYRITDYVATTNGDMESRSANHPFDIIVTADDERTLNEHARAIMHDGDLPDDIVDGETRTEYFAGCDLAAWDVWYCLDNDTIRFAWALADAPSLAGTVGRGVVYRLVDEFQNDCPYDFKGIQFKANGSGATDVWRYTFDSGASSGNTDLSLAGFAKSVFKNTIAPYPKSASGFKWALNRIVFKGSSCYSNTFGSGCYSNTFGSSCQFNTFDLGCYSNTFGSSCKFNTFGPDCHNNAFGSSCQFNTFGSGCDYNTFGLGCTYITFSSNCTYNTIDSKIGSKCSYITLGSGCDYNTFGSGCTYNKLGSECNRNTFGSSCRFNTFGPGCDYNTFGVNCHNNAFGSGCHHNTFGVNCYDNTFGTDCHCNTFGTGCYVGDWLVDSQRYVGTVVGYDGVLYPVLKRYRGSFLTTQTYLVGETLYCDSQYWECTTEHSGAWTAAHFAPLGPRPFGSILSSSSDKYVPRSYYRGVELEDGVSYVALDCTANRNNSVYYQNVTVSKGIAGTESAPKHIEDANYSQDYKTTYQPADSQTIAV